MLRLLVLTVAACMAPAALAQSGWKPAKNVEVIVGTSAGGAADYTARLLQKLLQRSLPGGAVVVNKPGASYTTSFLYLNQHAGDGHYIAISPINLVTNRILGLGALSNADITPLAQLISDYHVFSVLTESPIKTAVDLLDRLRKDPSSLSIAISPGIGSANHFAVGTIFKAAGVEHHFGVAVPPDELADYIKTIQESGCKLISATSENPMKFRDPSGVILEVGTPDKFPR